VQRTGHLDHVSVTHNERRRGQRPKPMPGIARAPLHHKRPAYVLFRAVSHSPTSRKALPRAGVYFPSNYAWSPSFLHALLKKKLAARRFGLRRGSAHHLPKLAATSLPPTGPPEVRAEVSCCRRRRYNGCWNMPQRRRKAAGQRLELAEGTSR
jgi:hypothetical protein